MTCAAGESDVFAHDEVVDNVINSITSSISPHPAQVWLRTHNMNAIQFHDLLLTPLAMLAIAFVIVVLMALTMNAVVKRERAMMVRVS
ncbi:MAG: hypothetical protein K0U70_01555 [Actinomycetia bacterium]|nr:hypothetical protein [Actinomycetes bacterium]MCH9708744.1 hypothetical protein [Actinomycetes bacterium]MCH9766464.1 hypothetical protein [Actinomycetes bacterium]